MSFYKKFSYLIANEGFWEDKIWNIGCIAFTQILSRLKFKEKMQKKLSLTN